MPRVSSILKNVWSLILCTGLLAHGLGKELPGFWKMFDLWSCVLAFWHMGLDCMLWIQYFEFLPLFLESVETHPGLIQTRAWHTGCSAHRLATSNSRHIPVSGDCISAAVAAAGRVAEPPGRMAWKIRHVQAFRTFSNIFEQFWRFSYFFGARGCSFTFLGSLGTVWILD